MKAEVQKKLVNLLLGLSLYAVVVTPSKAVYEDCNAIYVGGEGVHTPGKCASFPECPILFDIIKSPSKTTQEIKLIQKLTCKPDDKNPLVCCALDDMNDVEYTVRNKQPSGSNNLPSDSIVFAPPEKSQQKEHSNFRLLPKIQECGSAVGRDRIIGGTNASILDFPWLARIGYYSFDDDTIKYLCSGTVINKRYILSAAHCTKEINPDEYEPRVIRLAQPDEEPDNVWGLSEPIDIEIDKIIAHENYNKRDKSNDIGLIRLKKDIPYDKTPFICPVCLPFVEEYKLSKEEVDPSLHEYFDTGLKNATVAGWGKTRWNDNEGSPNLLQVALPVISQSQCQKNYENHARVTITQKQLCAGGMRGEDSCGGDSGGGLFITRGLKSGSKGVKQLRTFQFGVVSFGPTQCGVGSLPGVYSNIYAYKQWILNNIEP